MKGYDTTRLNGSSLRCGCGRRYYETDGPCHVICDDCGKGFKIEDDELIDGVCLDCLKVRSDKAIDEATQAGV